MDRMGGGAAREQVLTCTPAIRQSCGCGPQAGDRAPVPAGVGGRRTAAERTLVTRLASLAKKGDTEGFMARLDAALTASPVDDDLRRWIDLLAAVRVAAFPRGGGAAAAALFESASGHVGETGSRMQAARRVNGERRMELLREISAYLAGAFDLPLMLRRLEEGLVRLGIRRGYVALFDGDDSEHRRSRLILATRPGRRAAVIPAGRRFATERLLPASEGEEWRRGSWILEPLVYQDEALGYVLLSGEMGDPAVYDTLREQLASALKGALLLEQVRTHERRLEAEVARRTAELTRANRELTREVGRRQVLEREVLEVSNRTMQRIGQDLHDDLSQHLAGIAMLVSVLRGGIAAAYPAAAASLDQIGGLLTDSIARAKQIARGLYPAGLAEHGLLAAVEELVTTARRGYAAKVEFRAVPDFALADTDRAAQVYRIVQEALTNALKHSRAGRVEVVLSREGADGHGALVAEVIDNGIGLADSSAVGGETASNGAGMGLRIMRYRAESTGALLAIQRLHPGTRVCCTIPCEHREE